MSWNAIEYYRGLIINEMETECGWMGSQTMYWSEYGPYDTHGVGNWLTVMGGFFSLRDSAVVWINGL
jgi:hypothetical protein